MEVSLPERRRSSVARLAQSFRRTSIKSDRQEEGSSSSSPAPESRRPSIARLLSKTRSRTLEEEVGEVDDASKNYYGHLFFALPNEIQVLVLCKLNWKALLALRATSHGFHDLLHQNESAIVRGYIHCPDFDLPPYCLSLFPPPKPPTPLSLDYIFGITHRHAVANQLAQVIATIIRDKIYGHPNAPDHYKVLEPKCKNMVKQLIPGLFTLFNFFEEYRRILLERVALDAKNPSQTPTPSLMTGVEEDLMNSYNGPMLLEAHNIYQVLFTAYTRSLRPPSYAGTLERSLRGWNKPEASSLDMEKLLIFGGLREVKNVIRHPTYKARHAALEKFMLSLGFGKKPYPQCSTLPALPCAVMAPLDYKTASRAAARLPRINALWHHLAPQVLIRREIVPSMMDVPDVYQFMSHMMESEDEDDNDSSTSEGTVESGPMTDGTNGDDDNGNNNEEDEVGHGGNNIGPTPGGPLLFNSVPHLS